MLKLLLGNPYVLIGLVAAFAALFGWAVWERHDAIAAAKGEQAARVELASATERANQNYAATQSCFAQVEQDKASIAAQNAETEKLRADRDALDAAAAQAELQARTARDAFDARVSDIEAEAKAHPENVVPVGTIVRARAPQLWN